jgi:broad specificity phosphatase PhoE
MGRPHRIVLLRHGESVANLDNTVYEHTPDHAIELTPHGVEQIKQVGASLRETFGDEDVQAYISPYRRAHQTLHALGIDDLIARVAEEPRLREQDWANYQDTADIARQRELRDRYGHFFYRFTDGESGADVYDRVSSFLETLHRQFARHDYPANALLITHGLTMRLFCMRWFHWSVEYFESLRNPGNGELRTLVRGTDGRYTLDAPFEQWRPTPLPPNRR